MLQPELLTRAVEAMERSGIEYMATGSIVSSLQGEPRATHDFDLVIRLRPDAVTRLTDAFPRSRYYWDQAAIGEAISSRGMFNVIDTVEGDKIDFWLLTDDPFDVSRFSRRRRETVLGVPLFVSSPEDTIVAKLRWAKIAGGSEKQIGDVIGIYEVQRGTLDLDYLDRWIKRSGVRELWQRVIDSAEPL